MLFDDHSKATNFSLPNAKITYFPNFLDPLKASKLFTDLREETPWRHDEITVFGKTYKQPRLTALYANNDKPYSYSNITMHPLPFTGAVALIRQQVQAFTDIAFTTCLANLYRDGQDSNGWHADDEKELGINPKIASVSLGAARSFKLRHKKDHTQKLKIELQPGSLLLMQGETQHYWQHQIPKTTKKIGPRINLTFRIIQ